ncbi:MAG TPA: acetate--CoA ligase, partial [Longimicrobiales bacterium]
MADREQTLEALLKEERRFAPPAAFRERANASDPGVYDRAAADPEAFWAEWARKLEWFEPWREVLRWKPPHAEWFVGGKLNASYNCLDRHLGGWRRNKAALVWEGEPGDTRTYTYRDLHREVSKFANVLKSLGVKKGDRVAIYLPMIPEAAIAMLSCARIGAPHSVVFGGFSSDSLRDRINDAEARVLVTADGGYRRGRVVPLKETADRALEETEGVRHVVVVRRGAGLHVPVHMKDGRDHWYDDLMEGASARCEAERLDSEDLLYILYTSGTTGKPKGVVHTTGGYLTQVLATTSLVFDLKEDDVYWCTADVGWVTGHSYIVYGPLANGATALMYEGAPDWPDRGRFWQLVEKYGVTILYTAPTAIRSFMKWGTEYVERHDMSSLRLLGSVGEPINPEAWRWYHKNIGSGNCPVVDTWWQTETGGIMITPLPGLAEAKPGSAMRPFPGIKPVVVNDEGNPVELGESGFLTLQRPWPGMLRTLWEDDERYIDTYWSRFGEDVYFAGDGARLDEDGHIWLLGRVDDVMNVSGHRMSTAEIESALVSHEAVAEAAVVGRSDPDTGQAISAFVTLRGSRQGSDELRKELREHVADQIGKIARPAELLFT